MRAFLIALLTFLMLPLAALAQATDRPNTILVLDGSGSMWGQIDGVNKIVIARTVIAEMLDDMADDVSLGLTVYGHRQRGSCADIETIVAPAPGTQDEILAAVNAINPRGRTPMTDAVIAAAQSLRSTEEAATVILVSDGIENCNPDPCAIAAELEATGVDFTAHVIGFDVASEPEARAQMQCIADNTGGQFLTADNATELGQALEQVVTVSPTPMRVEAQVLPEGNLPTRPVSWTLIGADGDVVSEGTPGPAIDVSLFPGTYVAQATRVEPDGPQTYQTSFTVIEGQTDLVIVAMPPIIETSQVTFTARVLPDMSVPASQLAWTLYDSEDTVLLGPVVSPGGNVALLPGEYRLEVERANAGTRHETRFTVEPNAPQEVIIPLPALTVEIDFVARIGDVGGVTITDPVIWDVEPLHTNPVTTNPATFSMSRGAYRVTAYWTAQEIERSVDFVVVDQPREIVVVFPEPVASATLTNPAQAPMGSTIQVGWTGPANPGDTLSVAPVGAPRTEYVNPVTLDATVNPATVLMPAEAGPFEIRYTDASTRQVIARAPILSTPVTATLEVPEEVSIGSQFEVVWTGPDYPNDMIVVTEPEASTHGYTASRRPTSHGQIASLTAPTEPGLYEVRYRMGQDGVILARASINVVAQVASLTGPASAVAGSTIELGWTGPDAPSDFVAITAVGETGNYRFANTMRTNEGNPSRLLMPSVPGDYELEYVLGEGRTRVVAVPITVTPASASLTAQGSAVAGATIEVAWTGPDYERDFIGITPVDGTGNYRFVNTTPTSEGSPLRVLMPSVPGDYMLEYVEGQDRSAITTVPITVTPATATLTAPATALAGSTIEVAWTGPDYTRDFIGVTPVGAEGNYRFVNTTRTSEGRTLPLLMPTEPGEYILEYVEGQDRSAITTVPITITEVEASITAPATAAAGSTIELAWTGPDYPRDFIGISRVGAEGNYRFDNTTRTSEGSPLRLLMPTEPGNYVLEYVVHQDRSSLIEVPITVTDVAATLTAPATAPAGSTIEVAWTGPDYPRDFIAIGRVGAEGGARWDNYTRTEEGAVLRLQMPPEPGAYVIRYFVDQDRRVLAEAQIELTDVAASLTAPATAQAGSTIEVAWTGPDYPRDFIAIGRVGAEGGARWDNYTRTEEGAVVRLQMPPEPGAYVIRYFVDQDRRVLAEAQIELTEVAASITAPATAEAGSTIEVAWTGPDYPRDFIAIGRVGAEGGARWDNYARTEEGSPLTLVTPPTAGEYVIRYFIDQDRVVQAEAAITLTAPAATLTVPASAAVGSMVEIGWTGPDYPRDFIAVGREGSTGGARWEAYTSTDQGSPLQVRMPSEPGSYVVRYIIDQDRVAIAEVPITLNDVAATLTAPSTAQAGGTVEVAWTGPNYPRDFIALGRAGADGGARWESYSRTQDGTTLTLNVPETPGAYVLRYFMDPDRRVLAELPITVQ
ncbi:VWA domain-containing protein [Gymnodinialimonas ceratoperidinii]|uniref:VWA domain-containing protein n=1 Tax=Gymnodinialimonas ceratoperidinii TaxID=2856823 RepID=A0A8F6TVA7_9RHOB|nr:VWA domain-containing protein [Gymnodinialimonas ceratoperidinii]QXT38538.1 VWA domain-containing protein [Gymnodinialimonas ceratoperidinii]